MKSLNYIRFRLFKSDMFYKTYRTFGFLMAILILISCAKEDKSGKFPTIRLLNEEGLIITDTLISPGEFMNFGFNLMEGDFPITEFLINVTADSSRIYFDTGMYVSQYKFYKTFSKSFDDNENWEFIVRDRYSQSASVSITIKNDSMVAFGEIDHLVSVSFGAQNNPTQDGFYSLTNYQTYSISDAKENQDIIDMLYYFYGEDENMIASPGANIEEGVFDESLAPSTWETRNTTRYIFTNLTPSDFEDIQNDSLLLVSYLEGEGKRKAKNLAADNIYSFKTQDSRFGLFIVNDVSGQAEGTINVDIKIQKKAE